MKDKANKVSQSPRLLKTCKYVSWFRDKADESIDWMLKDAGFELEALSDSSSVSAIDSEAEEEGETIEIN